MNKPKTRQKKRTTKGKPSQKPLYPSDLTPNYLDTPAKPIEVKKPINRDNYLNALARIPEVQKDLEALSKKPTKEKEREIWDKYIEIEFLLAILRNSKDFSKYNKHFHRSDAIHVLSNWEKDKLNSMSIFGPSEYRDGRHVILAVDITKKKGDIIKEFKKVLDRIEKDYAIPKDTTRDKDTEKDIWGVYDLREKNVKWSVIASRILGKYSRHNERQVIRYYDKAEKIINTVRQQVEETIITNAKRQKAENESKEQLNRMIEESKKERAISIGERLLQGIPKKTKRK